MQPDVHGADVALVQHVGATAAWRRPGNPNAAASAAASSAVGATTRRHERQPEVVQHAARLFGCQPVVAAAFEHARGTCRARRRHGYRRSSRTAPAAATATRHRRRSSRARARRSPETRRPARVPASNRVERRRAAPPVRPSRTRERLWPSRRRGVPPRCPARMPSMIVGGVAPIDRREDDDQRIAVRPRSARLRSLAGIRPAPADATMSTGLAMPASGGRNAASRARVASPNSTTSRPAATQASTARMPGSARVGDDRDAPPAGSGCASRHGGDVEHLVDRVGADHAGLLEQRVDGDVARRERRGVAAGCPRPGARASGLHHDDRLAAADAPRDAREPARIAERFEIEQDDRVSRVAFPVLQQIVARHVGLVADADECRQSELPFGGELENRDAERAALRRAATTRPLGGQDRRERRVEPDRRGSRSAGPCSWGRPCACRDSRTRSTSSCCSARPSSPASANPAEMTTSDLTPAAAQSSTTPSTAGAGTAMTARSIAGREIARRSIDRQSVESRQRSG